MHSSATCSSLTIYFVTIPLLLNAHLVTGITTKVKVDSGCGIDIPVLDLFFFELFGRLFCVILVEMRRSDL